MIAPINHYSLTNPASIFDEEALTALELCGRLAAKINELIADYTEAIKNNNEKIDDLYRRLTTDIHNTVESFVREMKENGEIDAAIMDALGNFTEKLDRKINTYDSMQDMKASPYLVLGAILTTQGYYMAGDGGGASYRCRERTETDIDNGGNIIILNDSLVAELIPGDTVYIKQFGAKGDGETDDTAAILAAANYVAAFPKNQQPILGSDFAVYITNENCHISMVWNVKFPGEFTYLKFSHSPTSGSDRLVDVGKVDTLVLTDYKRSTFHIGNATNILITANSNNNPNSAFAYNYFTGGTMRYMHINTVGDGWVNENVFDQLVMQQITIDGDYTSNNNRFYDVTLEGNGANNIINIQSGNGNYFRIRGEGGYTLTTGEKSTNNVVERTWDSTRNGNYVRHLPTYEQGVIMTDERFGKLNHYTLHNVSIWNAPYKNNIDVVTGLFTPQTYAKYCQFIIPIENMMLFEINIPKSRVNLTFYNAAREKIQLTDNTLLTGNLTFSADTMEYRQNSNLDRHGFAIDKLKNSQAAYVKVEVTNGNQTHALTGGSLNVWSVSRPKTFNLLPDCPTSASMPTQTDSEAIPVGYKVMNTAAGASFWGWMWNGSEWLQI